MRLTGTQFLTDNKTHRIKVQDPLLEGPARATKLAILEESAMDFALDIMMDFELPTAPHVTLGKVRGFESQQTDFAKTSGTVTAFATFSTMSGFKIRLELPIPICRGEFYRPSVCKINGKKYVLSQGLIDKIVAKFENTVPVVRDFHQPSRSFQHEENIKREIFSAPLNDTNFYSPIEGDFSY